jgi:hypothetical protein
MAKSPRLTLSVEILEEEVELSQHELCQACEISAEQLAKFIDEGLIDVKREGRMNGNFMVPACTESASRGSSSGIWA